MPPIPPLNPVTISLLLTVNNTFATFGGTITTSATSGQINIVTNKVQMFKDSLIYCEILATSGSTFKLTQGNTIVGATHAGTQISLNSYID